VKNTFLVIFSLAIIVLASVSHQALGGSVVSTVETKINYVSNGKLTSFITTENTLESALSKQNVTLEKNDLTEPPLTTNLTGQTLGVKRIPAVPILINDNGQSWVGSSAYKTKEDILKQLNVEVDKVDKVSIDIILDPVTENAIGQKISIERAPVYTVSVDGGDSTVHSWAKTVSEVLTNGSITLNQNDTVEPGKSDFAPTSGQITVTRINFADIEETVSIPFQTIQQSSYEMYKGQTKVLQEGQGGSKKQTVHVVYHNGVEVDRIVTSTTLVNAPVNKTIVVGVKPYNSGAWWDTLVAAGNKWGVNPADLFNVMTCESGGNPYSGNYYKGLFQYAPSTWAGASSAYPGGQFSGAAITDGNAQIWVTAWKASVSGWGAWGCKP
jgi:uncharacterized protein YabE (DUF348 family)